MSEITYDLVVLKLKTDPKYLVKLEMNKPYRIANAEVILLEANHCPGAVLFLFRIAGKVYLHTGDFRYCRKMKLYKELQNVEIDELYLDTTFCNPKHVFPPQHEAIGYICDKIKNILADKSRADTMFLIGTYTIGKERILEELVKRVDEKIYVSKQKLELFKLCRLSPLLIARCTTQPHEAKIHVVPMGTCRFDRLEFVLKKFQPLYRRIVAFRPTGWASTSKKGSDVAKIRERSYGNLSHIAVPYSEHSSFSELKEFVSFCKPHKIVPTVDCSTQARVDAQIALFKDDMNHSRDRSTLVPFLSKFFSGFSKSSSSQTTSNLHKNSNVSSSTSISTISSTSNSLGAVDDDEENEEMSECDDELEEWQSSQNSQTTSSAVATKLSSSDNKAANLRDDGFLDLIYPALAATSNADTKRVDSSSVVDKDVDAIARDALRAATSTDPLFADKLLSEQRFLLRKFEQKASRSSTTTTKTSKTTTTTTSTTASAKSTTTTTTKVTKLRSPNVRKRKKSPARSSKSTSTSLSQSEASSQSSLSITAASFASQKEVSMQKFLLAQFERKKRVKTSEQPATNDQ